MRFGVNYIPSKQWLHRWLDWDQETVDKDLATIAGLGFDHIRAHLFWPYFQVNPTVMCEHAMNNLKAFVGLCEKNNIDFCLSLFTGWMSSFVFLPSWVRRDQFGDDDDMFADEFQREAQKFYIREISKVVGNSPRFMGYDLGNELSALMPYFKKKTIEICDDWNREMMDYCEEIVPGKMHCSGVDHTPWFGECGFSKKELANRGKITAIHCWSGFMGAMEIAGIMGTESVHTADFFVEVARASSEDPNRPVWVQEIGTTPLWHQDGSTAAGYMRAIFESLMGQENVWGLTWWCSHDISRTMAGFPELEYELSILDENNNPKEIALEFKKCIQEYKENPREVLHRTTAIVVDEKEYDKDPWPAFHKFMELVKQGTEPAIVWKEKAQDEAYLRARGIDTLVPLA